MVSTNQHSQLSTTLKKRERGIPVNLKLSLATFHKEAIKTLTAELVTFWEDTWGCQAPPHGPVCVLISSGQVKDYSW